MTHSVFEYMHNIEAIWGPRTISGGFDWAPDENDIDSESDVILALTGMVCFRTQSCSTFRCKR